MTRRAGSHSVLTTRHRTGHLVYRSWRECVQRKSVSGLREPPASLLVRAARVIDH